MKNATALRRFNVWYSVSDGNFTNPSIWISNGSKRHTVPQPGDDVVISHAVTFNTTIVLNNVTVNPGGIFKGDSSFRYVSVCGNLTALGSIDFTGANTTLYLASPYNVITSFIPGNSLISYCSSMNQTVIPLTYYSLELSNGPVVTYDKTVRIPQTNVKTLGGDVTINNNLSIVGSVFEIGANSLFVQGTTLCYSGSGTNAIQKTQYGGSVIFVGSVGGISVGWNWNFTANDTVEFRGGIGNGTLQSWIMGTATYKFTTNQTITGGPVNCTGTFEIAAGVVLTLTGYLVVSGSINGLSSTSQLDIKGNLGFNSIAAISACMTTGIFNYNASPASVISYNFNDNYTLPYGTYSGLTITGNGTKTLGQNTVITSLVTAGAGTLEMSSFSFTNNGTTFNGNNFNISKNSATGAVVFVGLYSTQFLNYNSFGPATIEFRGGLNLSGQLTSSGTIKFTANQTLAFNPSNSAQVIINNILVSGPVVLTVTGGAFMTVNGTINGDDAGSTLDNRQTIIYQNPQVPMQTGILQCNAAANTFIYGLAGNQDVKAGIYRNLTLNGSGAKRLLGNVAVQNSYTLTAPATLNNNGFTLTNP